MRPDNKVMNTKEMGMYVSDAASLLEGSAVTSLTRVIKYVFIVVFIQPLTIQFHYNIFVWKGRESNVTIKQKKKTTKCCKAAERYN